MSTQEYEPPGQSPTYLLHFLTDEELPQRRFVLGVGSHVVGSGKEADVVLAAAGVSRRHAVIEVLPDGGVVVEDLGSKNGTFVHGRRVGRAVAVDGALVRFGVVEAQLLDQGGVGHRIAIGTQGGLHDGDESVGVVREDRSTARIRAADRVMACACEHLSRSTAGGVLSDILGGLAVDWVRVIPAARVEFLCGGEVGAETVVALASAGADAPEGGAALRVQTPDLAVEVWSEQGDDLGTLYRPIELCLHALGGLIAPAVVDATVTWSNVAYSGDSITNQTLNPAFRDLYRRAAKVAKGEIPVLIMGPSGSGKEVLARFMHEQSARVAGPFVALNCTALPGELLEAELFGIERGVATGVEARGGFIEQADGGTLFLDEIGDMPPETQAKLLRVLEGQGFYRVGGRGLISVDVRVVAATNRPIEQLVAEGAFREDLFHRVAAFVARVPSLCERPEDIPMLASRFFGEEQQKARVSSPGITRGALAAMVAYPWPGNVRELRNEIAKATLLLEAGEALGVEHLSARIREGAYAESDHAPLSLADASNGPRSGLSGWRLAAAEGDAGRARELLGIGKTSYYAKLKQLGLGGSPRER